MESIITQRAIDHIWRSMFVVLSSYLERAKLTFLHHIMNQYTRFSPDASYELCSVQNIDLQLVTQ